MTAVDYRCAIIELVAELFPPEDQDRWMLTPHSALDGDWLAVARIDAAYGDRHLACTCPPMESYSA